MASPIVVSSDLGDHSKAAHAEHEKCEPTGKRSIHWVHDIRAASSRGVGSGGTHMLDKKYEEIEE